MDVQNIFGEIKRFDPSFEIAESWRRLAHDPRNIQAHDWVLIRHELMEMDLVERGVPQNMAHDLTNLQFNYTKKAKEYYDSLRKDRNESITHEEER